MLGLASDIMINAIINVESIKFNPWVLGAEFDDVTMKMLEVYSS